MSDRRELWLLVIGVASFAAAAVIVANRTPPLIRPHSVYTLSAQKQAIRTHHEEIALGVRGDAGESEAFTEDGPWIAVFTSLDCEVCSTLDSVVTAQARQWPSMQVYWHFVPGRSGETDFSGQSRQYCARSARLASERLGTRLGGPEGNVGGLSGSVTCDERAAQDRLRRSRELATALHLAGVPVIVGRTGFIPPDRRRRSSRPRKAWIHRRPMGSRTTWRPNSLNCHWPSCLGRGRRPAPFRLEKRWPQFGRLDLGIPPRS